MVRPEMLEWAWWCGKAIHPVSGMMWNIRIGDILKMAGKSWGLRREVKADVTLETLPCEICMFTPWLWGLPRRGPFSRCLCQMQTSGTTQEMSSVLTLLLSFTHFPADLELWQPFWGLCWTTYRKEVWHSTGWISGYQAKTANGCTDTHASCQ